MNNPRQNTNPWPFLMPSTVVIPTQAVVPWPCYSERIDHEIELGIIIGKTCHKVTAEQAGKYIGGYTIVNDISARSVTLSEQRDDRDRDTYFDWLMGKWSDGFLPTGPWMTTPDDIDDPHNLDLTLKVNEQIRQNENTSQMIFSVYDIVSFLSHLMTLEPGDLIATGTPCGVGWATDTYLQPGDKVECTIEHLGTLANTIGEKPEKFYTSV